MKVTVCIPVYNVEKYIKRCLESVVNQSYKDLEIIVVNDCTPDNSMAIVEKYAHEDNRIKILNHEHNKGLMWARKTGYMAATGDYVTFCDSDDALPTNSIELLLSAAKSSDADVVSGNYTSILINNIQSKVCSSLQYGNDRIAVYKSLLKRELCHNLWSKLFRRTLLQDFEYKTFDNFTNGEDACLFYQLVENVKLIKQIDQSVYYYYQNMESSTNVQLSEKSLRSIAMVNKLRVEICGKYIKLEKYFKRYVFMLYSELVYSGYNKDGVLDRIFKEYNLKNYTLLSKNWRYLSIRDFLLIFVRRFK